MALTTLASVKAQAGISAADSSRDDQLRSFIGGVTSLVKQWMNRDIESQEYTEFYSGNNSPFLLLRQYPVTAVSLVCVDQAGYNGDAPNAFPTANNLVSGVDYTLMCGLDGQGSTGILRRIGGAWYSQPSRQSGSVQNFPAIASGNIKVTYTAGFAVIPPAIVMAVNLLVIKLVNQAIVGGGAESMSYEDAAVTYLTPADTAKMMGSIESILARYKSIPI